MSDLVAALRRELAGYEVRGLADRAAAVRAELAKLAKIDGTSGGDAVVTEGPGSLSADPAPPSPIVEEATAEPGKVRRTTRKGAQ